MHERPSLDSRRFRAVGEVAGGEVGGETVFVFHQEGDLVHARYAGGKVRLGYLVGIRGGDSVHFRYTQVNTAGETSTGHSDDRLVVLADGKLALHEQWAWDSHEGSGTSTLEEIAPVPSGPMPSALSRADV